MADTATTTKVGETVPADDADSMKGWTAQQENVPLPNAREIPQQFVEAQLPDQERMDELGLTIPENQQTDDETLLDPADQVRLGNIDYASPLGVPANPEGAHIPGEAGADSTDMGGSPADANAGETDLNSMTKAELEEEAAARGVQVNSSMTKSEMIEAIEAG